MAAQKRALSLCGCGFLGVYHAGAVAGLRDRGALEGLTRTGIVGASAGALVGAIVACGGHQETHFLERYLPAVLDGAARARRQPFGLLTPGFRLLDDVAAVLRSELPPHAHELASGKLHVALTTLGGGGRRRLPRQEFVSQFPDREALLEAVLRSCCIPGVTGGLLRPGGGLPAQRASPSLLERQHVPSQTDLYAIDGGLLRNWPPHPVAGPDETLFIAPFASSALDICPALTTPLKAPQTPAQLGVPLECSSRNVRAAWQAFFPPRGEVLEEWCERGYRDAQAWCERQGDAEGLT